MGKAVRAPRKKPPATMEQANANSHPFHRMLGKTLLDLGGEDFIADWAEEHPSEFMRLMMATVPPQQPAGSKGSNAININLHPGLAPGPLDVVSDQ